MKIGYSKENICLCTQDMTSFKEFLPISGFHGQHLTPEKYAPPADLLLYYHEALSLIHLNAVQSK